MNPRNSRTLRQFTFLAVSLVLFLHGPVSCAADQASRTKTSYEDLNASDTKLYEDCEGLEKLVAATVTLEDRKPFYESLAQKAAVLTANNPNLFRAWLWIAQADVALDNKNGGINAINNLIDLGAADSSNPRVTEVIAQGRAKGWVFAQARSSSTATATPAPMPSAPAVPVAATPAPSSDSEKEVPMMVQTPDAKNCLPFRVLYYDPNGDPVSKSLSGAKPDGVVVSSDFIAQTAVIKLNDGSRITLDLKSKQRLLWVIEYKAPPEEADDEPPAKSDYMSTPVVVPDVSEKDAADTKAVAVGFLTALLKHGNIDAAAKYATSGVRKTLQAAKAEGTSFKKAGDFTIKGYEYWSSNTEVVRTTVIIHYEIEGTKQQVWIAKKEGKWVVSSMDGSAK